MPQPYPNGELVIVIDCSDLDVSAGSGPACWVTRPAPPAGTGEEGTGEADGSDRYRSLQPDSGAGIDVLLQRVPDVKGQKNRLHLDLRTPDLDAEVRRVLDLGARLLTREPVTEDGWSWHILADPDGNEFCVLQPPGIHRHERPINHTIVSCRDQQRSAAFLTGSSACPPPPDSAISSWSRPTTACRWISPRPAAR